MSITIHDMHGYTFYVCYSMYWNLRHDNLTENSAFLQLFGGAGSLSLYPGWFWWDPSRCVRHFSISQVSRPTQQIRFDKQLMLVLKSLKHPMLKFLKKINIFGNAGSSSLSQSHPNSLLKKEQSVANLECFESTPLTASWYPILKYFFCFSALILRVEKKSTCRMHIDVYAERPNY